MLTKALRGNKRYNCGGEPKWQSTLKKSARDICRRFDLVRFARHRLNIRNWFLRGVGIRPM